MRGTMRGRAGARWRCLWDHPGDLQASWGSMNLLVACWWVQHAWALLWNAFDGSTGTSNQSC